MFGSETASADCPAGVVTEVDRFQGVADAQTTGERRHPHGAAFPYLPLHHYSFDGHLAIAWQSDSGQSPAPQAYLRLMDTCGATPTGGAEVAFARDPADPSLPDPLAQRRPRVLVLADDGGPVPGVAVVVVYDRGPSAAATSNGCRGTELWAQALLPVTDCTGKTPCVCGTTGCVAPYFPDGTRIHPFQVGPVALDIDADGVWESSDKPDCTTWDTPGDPCASFCQHGGQGGVPEPLATGFGSCDYAKTIVDIDVGEYDVAALPGPGTDRFRFAVTWGQGEPATAAFFNVYELDGTSSSGASSSGSSSGGGPSGITPLYTTATTPAIPAVRLEASFWSSMLPEDTLESAPDIAYRPGGRGPSVVLAWYGHAFDPVSNGIGMAVFDLGRLDTPNPGDWEPTWSNSLMGAVEGIPFDCDPAVWSPAPSIAAQEWPSDGSSTAPTQVWLAWDANAQDCGWQDSADEEDVYLQGFAYFDPAIPTMGEGSMVATGAPPDRNRLNQELWLWDPDDIDPVVTLFQQRPTVEAREGGVVVAWHHHGYEADYPAGTTPPIVDQIWHHQFFQQDAYPSWPSMGTEWRLPQHTSVTAQFEPSVVMLPRLSLPGTGVSGADSAQAKFIALWSREQGSGDGDIEMGLYCGGLDTESAKLSGVLVFEPCSCAPVAVADCESLLGAECGVVSDRCGGTLDCGTCPSGATCGSSFRCECADGRATCGGACCAVGLDCLSGSCVDPNCLTGQVCDDGNPCTQDVCDAQGNCLYLPEPWGTSCDDSSACSLGDACDGAGSCVGAPLDCDDGDPCTLDTCLPASGCDHQSNPCDDGVACTEDSCDGLVGCVNAPLDAACDDGEPCTDDLCDAVSGCSHSHNTDPCDDGDPCTTGDTCVEGVCIGTELDCDDGNDCTSDSCYGGVCQHLNVSGACDDGLFCTTDDYCWQGVCGGEPNLCDDGVDCTNDTCDDDLDSCVNLPDDGQCSDWNQLPCRVGVCTASGCASSDTDALCSDGNPCTEGDRCQAGVCALGEYKNCDDGLGCTDDDCDEQTGDCLHEPQTGGCDDGDPCTELDTCQSDGFCVGAPVDCDDGDACTLDTCDSSAGTCQHATVDCGVGDPNVVVGGCDPNSGCQRYCRFLTCGESCCDDGDVCAQERSEVTGEFGPVCCTPLTCGEFVRSDGIVGAECGTIPDGCGGVVQCGPCGIGPYCGSGGVAHKCEVGTLPPDPGSVTPAYVGPGRRPFHETVEFLYTGDVIQSGVTSGIMVPERVGLAQGRVYDRAGQPLPDVTISVKNYGDFGSTKSRADGAFDMAVNGGRRYVLNYTLDGYYPAQRTVYVGWNAVAEVADVVLVEPGPAHGVDTNSLNPADRVVTAATTSAEAAGDGARSVTLIFAPGATATPEGAVAMTEFDVRATEYTVGELGPAAMPGELPPSAEYTYCVELTAASPGEALDEQGDDHVVFDPPLAMYVDNFLDFPLGAVAPLGFYDRDASAWVAGQNGVVLAVTGCDADGRAVLDIGTGEFDVNGTPTVMSVCDYLESGGPDAVCLCEFLGVPSADCTGRILDELERLADARVVPAPPAGACPKTLTTPIGLWRLELGHFSSADVNPGGGGWAGTPSGNKGPRRNPKPCKQRGSIIECENGVLGERLPIAGTSFFLDYRSNRSMAETPEDSLTVSLTDDDVPDDVVEVEARVHIEGERVTGLSPRRSYSLAPETNLSVPVTVPGHAGIRAYGVNVGYTTPIRYELNTGGGSTGEGATGIFIDPDPVFNRPPGTTEAWTSWDRDEGRVTSWVRLEGFLGHWNAKAVGLGGWTLNVVHHYDPRSRTLHYGDGRTYELGEEKRFLSARSIADSWGYVGEEGLTPWPWAVDFGPFNCASMPEVRALAVSPEGHVHAASPARVFRLNPGNADEPATLIASFNAASCAFTDLRDLEFGPDGRPYVVDATLGKVLRIEEDGSCTHVAGAGCGNGPLGPSFPSVGIGTVEDARDAQLCGPEGIAFGPDGSLYVADTHQNVVRRVDMITSDGAEPRRMVTAAGVGLPAAESESNANAFFCTSASEIGDGELASRARLWAPVDVDVAPDGRLYITEEFAGRVRRVDAAGRISTIAGGIRAGGGCRNAVVSGYMDGVSAVGANVEIAHPTSISVAPDGTVYFLESGNRQLRRIDTDGLLWTAAGRGDELSARRVGASPTQLWLEPKREAHGGNLNGLDVAPDGALYVTDDGKYGYGMHRIIRIELPAARYQPDEDGDPDDETGELEDVVYVPDESGKVVYVFDQYGTHQRTDSTTSYVPDDDGDGSKPQTLLEFTYDDQDRVTSITDREGRVTTLTYGADIVDITAPHGQVTRLELGPDGWLSTLRITADPDVADPPADGVLEYEAVHSGDGLLREFHEPGGAVHRFSYGEEGHLESDMDATGASVVIERRHGPLDDAREVAITSAEGVQVTYSSEQDDNGALFRRAVREGGDLTPVQAESEVFYAEFLEDERNVRRLVSEMRRPDGLVIRSVGDHDPRFGTTVPVPLWTELEAAEHTKRVDYERGWCNYDGASVETYVPPEAALSPVPSLCPDGETDRVFRARTTVGRSETSDGRSWLLEWDDTAKTATSRTPTGRELTAMFDGEGRPVQVARPGRGTVHLYYEEGPGPAAGRLLRAVTMPDDPTYEPRVIDYDYVDPGDLRGDENVLACGARRGAVVGLNSASDPELVTDPAVDPYTETEYDALGRPAVLRESDGLLVESETSREILLGYDGAGDLALLEPPGKSAHGFDYTLRHELESYSPPPPDQLGSEAYPTNYAYDADGRLVRMELPPDRLPGEDETADLPVVTLGYDGMGRPESIAAPYGDFTATYAEGSDQLLSVSHTVSDAQGTPLSTTTFSVGYDGPLVESHQLDWGDGQASYLLFDYDDELRLAGLCVSGASTCDGDWDSISYDDDGLLTGVGVLTAVPDPTSGLLSETSIGGYATDFAYNPFGELESMAFAPVVGEDGRGTALYAVDYLRDRLGRVTLKSETVESAQTSEAYTYDRAGRLVQIDRTEADGTTSTTHVDHDENGNRVSFLPATPEPGGWEVDDQDRLAEDDERHYAYNPRGQLRCRSVGELNLPGSEPIHCPELFDYAVDGALQSVTLTVASDTGTQVPLVVRYEHDPLRRRVGRSVTLDTTPDDELGPTFWSPAATCTPVGSTRWPSTTGRARCSPGSSTARRGTRRTTW